MKRLFESGKLVVPILLLLTLLTYSSCGPSTEITGSWSNPEAPRVSYNDVFVATLSGDLRAKQTIESQLANELQSAGIRTGRSFMMFAPNFTDEDRRDREELLGKIRESGYNSILTVTLLDKETETRYVPGTYGYTGYAPMGMYGWYGNFWGYYSRMYPIVYDPGYYRTDNIYYLETNLYDAETEKLVWSAQSRTYNPDNIVKFSEEFASIIVNQLKEEGLIMKPTS